jgi:peroxiredoxin Q/BCP
MSKVQIGRLVPNFKCPATGDKTIELNTLRGSPVVIYFYPKDNTSGCTTEGCDFKASHLKFRRQNTIILGVSRDTISSHEKFKNKFKFPFDLLADCDEKVCKLFDVIKEKNMYGRKVLGIERSTFLIDASGRLRNEWRKVKVKEHVDLVLDAVKAL